ncbi:hypothetical protein [uncultured Fusobacterium sp.]|uniref:hypothetical protein n=1 Tax=uncultured Fusobacterium sp. TaxID=159267 RepID=UPI0025DC45B3|nr:hypothetical protein [uncultured Fusobacterium sp.]
MAILTKFLQLLKPEKNDYVDVEKHLSENYDKIDAKMEELSNSNDEKLDKGNVPDVLNSAEKIIKALQGNTGIKFDENLLYLNDSGTKKKGYCYIDKLTDGIFECIQETTTTVNNATYFKNFSNKENSDRLSNLIRYYDTGVKEISINNYYEITIPFKNFIIEKAYVIYDGEEIDIQCNQYGDSHQINGIWFQYAPNKLTIVCASQFSEGGNLYYPLILHCISYVKNGIKKHINNITTASIRVILRELYIEQ